MKTAIISIGAAAVLLAAHGASAQAPVCPFPYTNATCSPDPPGGGSGPNVCAYDSGDSRYECTELSDYADQITVITDSGYVLAWGRKSWGLRLSSFCCRYYFGNNAPDLYVNAGDGNDKVYLHSPGDNDYEGTTLVYDTNGSDEVRGSDYEDCDFPCDTISLGGWGDSTHTVVAGKGDDWIWVATGTNTLDGGDGHDMIVGYFGQDTVEGGRDDDVIL
jgi:Ca2+-binding RTX toxin-like protein